MDISSEIIMFAFLKKLFKREEKTVVASRLWVDTASPEPVKKLCLVGEVKPKVVKEAKPKNPKKVKEVIAAVPDSVKVPTKRGRKPKVK